MQAHAAKHYFEIPDPGPNKGGRGGGMTTDIEQYWAPDGQYIEYVYDP